MARSAKQNTDIGLERVRTGQLQHRLALQQQKFEEAKKAISLKELYGRFLAALGRDDVDLNWPIGKLIRGPASAVWAVAVKIMGAGGFQSDGLILQKSDVLACKKISDLLKLILKWYESNGWVVD